MIRKIITYRSGDLPLMWTFFVMHIDVVCVIGTTPICIMWTVQLVSIHRGQASPEMKAEWISPQRRGRTKS